MSSLFAWFRGSPAPSPSATKPVVADSDTDSDEYVDVQETFEIDPLRDVKEVLRSPNDKLDPKTEEGRERLLPSGSIDLEEMERVADLAAANLSITSWSPTESTEPGEDPIDIPNVSFDDPPPENNVRSVPKFEESSLSINWQPGGVLGQGSFGTVRLGLNLDTGELIAVKQVELNQLNSGHAAKDLTQIEEVKSLMQEIALLKTMTNEHIVRYLGCSVDGQTFNIFEEYVPGGSIASIIKKFGPINESLIKVYTKQILFGLVYLHSRKIIHRDVKGANILVDTRGSIKLADFGAAKKIEGLFASTNRSGIGSLKGTVFWMAPEVIRESSYNYQCDIWSLGCTVVEMSSGKPPWSGAFDDQVSALFAIATTASHPPIPDNLSELGKDFLLMCFKIDPLARPKADQLLQHPWLRLNAPESPFAVQISPLRSPLSMHPGDIHYASRYTSEFDNFVYDRPEIELHLPADKFKQNPSPRDVPSSRSNNQFGNTKRQFRSGPGTPKF